MLQQTQVKTVIPYWERWMQHFPTVAALAVADEQRVLKLWEGLGYYTRARNLQKAARIICEKHSAKFPRAFNDILALPGIGRYTAGAIASIAYGDPAPIIDGNVIRVLSRQFALEGDPKSPANQKHLWLLSTQLVQSAHLGSAPVSGALIGVPPNGSTGRPRHHHAKPPRTTHPASALNQGLMELGATICTPRDPQCPACPIRRTCKAFRLNRVTNFPQIPERKKPYQRRFVAYIFRHDDSVLIRKRNADVVNGNLWEFPNFEILPGKARAEKTRFGKLQLRPFATVKHTITNNRITLEAAHAEVNGEAQSLATELCAEWRLLADLNLLPFTSAHSKLRALLFSSVRTGSNGIPVPIDS